MAVAAHRGYDPTTLAWKNVPASTSEDSVPPTDIVDEGLFTVMTLRKRRQQSNTAKASDTDKAKSAKTPPKKKTSRVSWRPAAMPRNAAEDFTIVLKLRVTVDLKAAFQPACYCCGTVGHRPELCPHPNDQRCGHCGLVVGASEEGMTPHECKPSCLVCGEEHLTGSPACKAKFRRLQQTGGQHGGRGSLQQRPKHKTSDVTPEGHQSASATSTQDITGVTEDVIQDPRPGRPVFLAGEFPPLTSGGAPRQPAKKTSSQNAQLLVKIATLEAGSTPSTPASPPPPLPKITVAVPEPKPMCVAPSVSEPSNTEQRFQAIESAMTALVTQLTTMSKSIENLSNTVTHQVTSNIKTWLQDTNPRSRRASPLKDVNRPSKLSYTNDLAELSEDSESLLAQGTNVGAESIPATPNSHLYLETFEHLCAVGALQEPGNAVRLTGYNTFQRDPFTCLLVHKTLTAQEVDLDLSIPYSYTMVTILPLRRADPPVHILNIYCRPKLKKITFADTFTRALKIAGRDPLLIVGDFNAPSRLWGYRKEEMREAQRHLHRAFHNFHGSTTQLALSLRDRYLCTEQDPRGPEYHYAGRENSELDAPFQLHDLRAALAKMRRGTAPGRDKLTVKVLANLPDTAHQSLLEYINVICEGNGDAGQWRALPLSRTPGEMTVKRKTMDHPSWAVTLFPSYAREVDGDAEQKLDPTLMI
ncbi:hypothetical protein HPB49_010867 [Dermacentor silvarum]|uniref:Uncharacterized protein n=1 Tax=Dermacentor silvarum TaxID=543639 RepID=A0ACB8C8U2_DERSI|nr:hypothetical protein HPB49_010867 [Dermacentor silvarum]